MADLEALLQPSLIKSDSPTAIYSSSTHFWVAFLGGPTAVVLFALFATYKIQKLKQHLLLLSIFLLGSLASSAFIFWLLANHWPHVLMLGTSAVKSARMINQMTALMFYGGIYWALRPYFQLGQLTGETPSPWLPAIAAIMLGFCINLFFIFGFEKS